MNMRRAGAESGLTPVPETPFDTDLAAALYLAATNVAYVPLVHELRTRRDAWLSRESAANARWESYQQ